MAIYHLHAKTGSRTGAQSALAHASYIERTGAYERAGDRVLYVESGHLPGWVQGEAGAYWEAADLYERANGRLYQAVEFALPVELESAERIALAREFALHLTAGARMPYELAIHAGYGRNPHVHLMISERMGDGIERSREQWFRRWNRRHPERGGAQKNARVQTPEWLRDARATWAELANRALANAGRRERIDARTYLEQGIDRVPQVHLGPNVVRLEQRGIRTDRGARARAVEQRNAEIVALEVRRRALARSIDRRGAPAAVDASEIAAAARGAEARDAGVRGGSKASERSVERPQEGRDEREHEDRRGSGKRNVGAIGAEPPPGARNRLRAMSELGVVPLGDRGEVLLPGDVRGELEQQGAERDHGLRRTLDRPGLSAERTADGGSEGARSEISAPVNRKPAETSQVSRREEAARPSQESGLRSRGKANVGAVGMSPPAAARHRLRGMSDLAEVGNGGGDAAHREGAGAEREAAGVGRGGERVDGAARPATVDGGPLQVPEALREHVAKDGGRALQEGERGSAKHAVARIGSEPPPGARNRLRGISELEELRIGERGAVRREVGRSSLAAAPSEETISAEAMRADYRVDEGSAGGSLEREPARGVEGESESGDLPPSPLVEVERQLAAIGGSQFEVQVQLEASAESWRGGPAEVVDQIAWLQAKNAEGAAVRVRPCEEGPSASALVLSGLGEQGVPGLCALGYEPAAVVETAPGRYEAWVRAGRVSAGEREEIGARLAAAVGGEAREFGQLAGFRSQATDRGRGSWVRLREWSGRMASAGTALVHWARRRIEQREESGIARERRPQSAEPGRESGGWVSRSLARLRSSVLGRNEEREPMVESPSAVGKRTGPSRAVRIDRTAEAVSRQLEAMGFDRYEIGIRDRESGQMLERTWTREQVGAGLPWLKAMNAEGKDIFVRGARDAVGAPLILVDDVTEVALGQLEQRGLEPAVVVETSPRNFQAWVRVPEGTEVERTLIAQGLALEFGGDRGSADWRHYGRLAGFTNRKPERRRPDGLSPYVLLHESRGRTATRGAERVEGARATLEVEARAAELRATSQARAVEVASAGRGRGDPVEFFRGRLGRLGGADASVNDFKAAVAMALAGYRSEQIAEAMRVASPRLEERKRGHVEEYITRTVERALSSRVVSGVTRAKSAGRAGGREDGGPER